MRMDRLGWAVGAMRTQFQTVREALEACEAWPLQTRRHLPVGEATKVDIVVSGWW